MFAVVSFNNAQHKDNEQTKVYGPFVSSDLALRYAEHNVKFYHVVRIEGVIGSGVKTMKAEG